MFVANLFLGSVKIPAESVFNILSGGDGDKESWRYIVLYSRLPQAVTAVLCGSSLAVAGLMLQTSFNNYLAGPSILGISSGAGLGAAIVMLAGVGGLAFSIHDIFGFIALLAGSFFGSVLVLGLLIFFSSIVKNNVMILIIGIMIGYIASSVIAFLNYFSTSEGVRSFVIWGLGNFGGVTLSMLPYYALISFSGLLIAIFMIKPLNAMLLGINYAENLGVNIKKTRNIILLSSGLLISATTSFCGPVAFIGLAVPHMARLIFKTSNHRILMPATMLLGPVIALVCNLISSLPGESGLLPLNAITPIIGAPVIIYVIINNRKIKYFS